MKAGRNDPCSCGSGRKYKKCCGLKAAASGNKSGAPATPDVSLLLRSAMQHHQLGDLHKAGTMYHQLLLDDPDNADVLHLQGILSAQLGKHDAAIEYLRKAISRKENDPRFHYNLGKVYAERGDPNAAISCYLRATMLDPKFPDAHVNLGRLFKETGLIDRAILSSRQALALLPVDPEAHYNLGTALMANEALAEAITCFRRALELKPDFAKAHDNLGNALKEQGRLSEAVACYRRALVFKPDFAESHSNLLLTLNYEPAASWEIIAQEHRRFGEFYKAGNQPDFAAHRGDPNRPVRVGYVSADFRDHSCAFFIEPLLAAHSRSLVETFCYSDVKSPDATTLRIQHIAHHWRNTFGLKDEDVAKMIRADEIDILVDLSGHTAENRLRVFAQRAAPVQVTWLGYPNTTGLDTMDYRLTDRLTDPEGVTDDLHTEHLARLPVSFLCYQPPLDAPQVNTPPFQKSGHVTFGCFNNTSKITPAVVALWSLILQAVPGSRLILKSKQLKDVATCQRYLGLFAVNGIASDRLDLIGPMSLKQDHLAAYGNVDIALDPFPYNGTTTTCEALWMGVPVIVLAGEVHAGRVGLSLLHTVQLDELVAESASAYRDKAIELAGNPSRIAELRQTLRERVIRSPLCDRSRFASNVEAFYREAWQRWCLGADGRLCAGPR